MTLVLDIPLDVESRLREEAAKRGVTADEYALRVLEKNLRTDRRPPLSQLLEQWRREDATDDPDEIRRAEEELAEFKRQMNANRADEEPLFV